MSHSLRHPWRAMILVGGAALLNLVPVELPGGARFFLGPFFYFPLVLVLPQPWAILSAAVPMAVTLHTTGEPFTLLLAVAEAAWLGAWRRYRPRWPMAQDCLFWLIVSPLVIPWLYGGIVGVPDSLLHIEAGKQFFNQFGAVSIAVLLLRQTSLARWLDDRVVSRRRVRDMVFHSVFALAIVPLALVGIGLSVLLRAYCDREDREVLRETGARLAEQLDLFFKLHAASVASAARAIGSGLDPDRVLHATRGTHPDLLTMIVADSQGQVTHAAPQTRFAGTEPINVADRDYFRAARDQGQLYISGVFHGRGFGRDLIVAISAPIYDSSGGFAGVVQSSLEIHSFAHLITRHRIEESVEIIFTDARGRVIFSDAADIPVLSSLKHFPQGRLLDRAEKASGYARFDWPAKSGKKDRFIGSAVQASATGVTVIAQQPLLSGLAGIGWLYGLFGSVAVGVLAAAYGVAHAARSTIALPLEYFAQGARQRTVSGLIEPLENRIDDSSHEVAIVFEAFNHLAAKVAESQTALQKQNEELDQRVMERTREAEAARRLAEAASRSKSEFLAMTSHEIRTPLNAIIGLADSLAASSLERSAIDRLHIIRDAGSRLLGVVNDLIDLSQIEAGKLTLNPAPVEVGAMCREVESLFALGAEQRGLQLGIEIEPGLPLWVKADRARLQQVLINLIGNALKFTEHGGIRLCVTAVPAANDALALAFAVVDTGPGISPEQQTKLFQPFVQLPGSARSEQLGSGLGLSISRRLVALFGGKLEVRSRVGAGSVFYFSCTVPTVVAPAEPLPLKPDGAPTQTPLAPKLRLLVADDNVGNQEVMRCLLERRCAHLVVVDNGDAAIAELVRQDFDVAFIDLEMPGVDGHAVPREIHARRASGGAFPCRLVACSAHPREHVWEQCAHDGFDDYLEKPVERGALVRILRDATRADSVSR